MTLDEVFDKNIQNDYRQTPDANILTPTKDPRDLNTPSQRYLPLYATMDTSLIDTLTPLQYDTLLELLDKTYDEANVGRKAWAKSPLDNLAVPVSELKFSIDSNDTVYNNAVKPLMRQSIVVHNKQRNVFCVNPAAIARRDVVRFTKDRDNIGVDIHPVSNYILRVPFFLDKSMFEFIKQLSKPQRKIFKYLLENINKEDNAVYIKVIDINDTLGTTTRHFNQLLKLMYANDIWLPVDVRLGDRVKPKEFTRFFFNPNKVVGKISRYIVFRHTYRFMSKVMYEPNDIFPIKIFRAYLDDSHSLVTTTKKVMGSVDNKIKKLKSDVIKKFNNNETISPERLRYIKEKLDELYALPRVDYNTAKVQAIATTFNVVLSEVPVDVTEHYEYR